MQTDAKYAGKADPLREKSFHLAVRIVKLCQYLVAVKKEFILSKQLLKSGTNPGAMAIEAANAESGLDFIHKLGIAQKETGETMYWLELLYATDYLTDTEFQSMHTDAVEVMKLIRSSIRTKKKNLSIKVTTLLLFIMTTIYLFP